MLTTIFYLSFFLILYIYLGYPLLTLIIGMLKTSQIKKDETYRPDVTLVIAAYNEELKIEEKIKNSLNLDYPKEKFDIIIFSDGSTDRTSEIVKKHINNCIKLIELPNRMGKTAGQNIAVESAQGEIIVFSDANAVYQKSAIKKIVRNFSDDSIGGVCGELVYKNQEKSLIGEAEDAYWNYEKFLKKNENNFNAILGANGSIYAIKKDLYIPLNRNIISDFIEPLKILEQGYRFLYEPEALSFEPSNFNFIQEYNRKKRIVNRSFYSLFVHREFLNPLNQPLLSFQLFSHKILRWFAMLFFFILFVSNLFLLGGNFYNLFFILQILFYTTALLGYLFEKSGKNNIIFYVPFYFCLVNLASLKGIFEYLFKRKKMFTWEPIRK